MISYDKPTTRINSHSAPLAIRPEPTLDSLVYPLNSPLTRCSALE